MKQPFEVADVFNLYGDQYQQCNSLSCEQIKVMCVFH